MVDSSNVWAVKELVVRGRCKYGRQTYMEMVQEWMERTWRQDQVQVAGTHGHSGRVLVEGSVASPEIMVLVEESVWLTLRSWY